MNYNRKYYYLTLTVLILMPCVRTLIWQELVGQWESPDNCLDILSNAKTTTCDCKRESSITNTRDSMIGYTINCPKKKPQISLRIHPLGFIQMQCFNIENSGHNNRTESRTSYELLPKMHLKQQMNVIINNCSFRATKSNTLRQILNHLGVNNMEYLEINNSIENIDFNSFKEYFNKINNESNNITMKYFILKVPLQEHLPEELFMDKGLQNLTELYLHINPLTVLTNNSFESIIQLKSLTLISQNADNINSRIRGSNNNLHSAMDTLPNGIFAKLSQLKHLQVQLNYIKNIRKELFNENLSSLTSLTITSTNVMNLPSSIFDNLINLESITIANNQLQQLPTTLFKYNNHLKVIKIEENQMKSLPQGFCKNLISLERIQIQAKMDVIPDDVFYNATNILYIDLSNNLLKSIPKNLFVSQEKLKVLDLSFNSLTELPDYLFTNTKNLKRLQLSNNQIKNLSENVFSSLIELQYLDIKSNQLIDIHMKCFSSSPKLQYINMANNYLTLSKPNYLKLHRTHGVDIFSPFALIEELKTLILKNNSINLIFSDWKYSHNYLKVLDLSHNKLEYLNVIDLQFHQSQTKYINLSYNSLNTLNFTNIEKLNLKDLMYLDLNENYINCNGQLLKFLEFYNNEISEDVSAKLKLRADTLKCLKPYNLKNKLIQELDKTELVNSITTVDCPGGCNCYERVFDMVLLINCSRNRLHKLPNLSGWEQSKYRAIELNLENNFIKDIDLMNQLLGYNHITKLIMANNNLTHIEKNTLPKNLTYLDLSYNSMRYLNSTNFLYLSSLISLKKLYLAGNPWQCDCKAKEWLQLIQQNIQIVDLTNVTCTLNHKIYTFHKLFDTDVCSLEDNNDIIIAVILSLICCLIILIVALIYYIYQQEIKIWLYAQNACLWFVTEDELDRDKKYDAFISYSHKDEEFISEYLMPNLEGGPNPFKLCVHTRDFIVGGYIPEQIVLSVENSRRTVIVLSENFIESVWGRMEFRAAHQAALNEGRARIIVIIYGDIGDTQNLDAELKAYLKMNTYLKWGDPWFWNKLRYAMPHRPKTIKLNKSREINMEMREVDNNVTTNNIFIRY